MAIRDLLPWRRNESKVPVQQEVADPFTAIQRDMNRMFDDFLQVGFGQQGDSFMPEIDIVEKKNSLVISADLPGMDEKDISLSLADNVLTLRGEKRATSEEKGDNYYRMERSCGSFRRDIPLPYNVDADKVDATYKRGVLRIVLPKVSGKNNEKRIKVLTG